MQNINRWRSDQFQPPFYFESGQFDTRGHSMNVVMSLNSTFKCRRYNVEKFIFSLSMKIWKITPKSRIRNENFSLLAGLTKKPISGRNRNLTGSTDLLSLNLLSWLVGMFLSLLTSYVFACVDEHYPQFQFDVFWCELKLLAQHKWWNKVRKWGLE